MVQFGNNEVQFVIQVVGRFGNYLGYVKDIIRVCVGYVKLCVV